MKGRKGMEELSIEKLKSIEGGASSTATINAIVKAISMLFTLGQALCNVIRRATTDSYCKI